MSRGNNRGGSGPTRTSPTNGAKGLLGTIHGDLFTKPEGFDKNGTSGTVVDCMANFVEISYKDSAGIYQYHVSFDPIVDSKVKRTDILNSPEVTEHIGKHFVFDGAILYINKEWKRTETIEAFDPTNQRPIRVQLTGSVRFTFNDPQAINLMNVIIRRAFDAVGLKQMGRHYFNQNNSAQVTGHKLEVWPGFETAIRVYDKGLMLCIENRFKVLRKETMLELMNLEFRRQQGNLERFHAKFDEQFKDTTIVTYYNNKLHRLTSVDWDMTPESSFARADGTEISLKDYMKEQYGREVTEMHQPIIVSEGKPKQPGEPPQRTFLVPEFCMPTGLNDDQRKDHRMMRTLSNYTRLSPDKRIGMTVALLEQMRESDICGSLFSHWGIELGTKFINLSARQLPMEKLVFNDNKEVNVPANHEWSRECSRVGNFRSANMKNWIVICPTNKSEYGTLAQRFIDEVKGKGRQLKMEIGDPLCEVVQGNADVQMYMQAIESVIKKADGASIDMIVCLLNDDSKTRYDAIKKQLCTSYPVPSQCLLLSTLSGKPGDGGMNKNFGSIVLKVILQMNCKMGGAVWKVNIPLKETMLMGYDLYNDSTSRGKTIGACVSTTNADYTGFYSQTRPHENPTELGTNLVHFVRKALHKYYETNKALPKKLILYRDGAGDGQIPYIRDQEVRMVKEACAEVVRAAQADHEIKLAFTIVTKKVNMRMFNNTGNVAKNPNPGTLVDRDVTRVERFDFYMVPQFVNQGTVTPVCYNVICNDAELTADQHHRLAYKLCFLYYNWQGSVRVPALCQYAHKLAFLVSQSVHKQPAENLRDKLFFL